MTLPTRTLGPIEVGAVGLGCMSFGGSAYGDAVGVRRRRGDQSGTRPRGHAAGHRGRVRSRVRSGRRGHRRRRDEVVLATKFGIVSGPRPGKPAVVNGRPEYVRSAAEASLRSTRHRPHRPVLPAPRRSDRADRRHRRRHGGTGRAAGKVRYLGLSEASVDTIRRAAAVHPIAALQSEWSLWSRDLEDDIVPVCRELGIGIVPFSPLGRGFLTGRITSIDELSADDMRRSQPRIRR